MKFEGERKINSSYGMIVDHIMQKRGWSLYKMAQVLGISRQQLYNQLNKNVGVEKFLSALDKLGYGITIRPLGLGDGIVDLSDESICDNCAYRRMGEALQDLKWQEGGKAVLQKDETPVNEETKID